MMCDVEVSSVDGEIRAVPKTPLGRRFFLQTNGLKVEENAELPEFYILTCSAEDFAEAASAWNLSVMFDGHDMVQKVTVH